jgi:hypothetical protein
MRFRNLGLLVCAMRAVVVAAAPAEPFGGKLAPDKSIEAMLLQSPNKAVGVFRRYWCRRCLEFASGSTLPSSTGDAARGVADDAWAKV